MKEQDNSTLKILHDISNLGKTSVSELSEIYDMNKSQIRYRIERINDYLTECGLENLIIEKESIISPFEWNDISEPLMKINKGDFLLDSLNSELRRSAECIFIFLSKNDVFLNDIISVFKISKNTALADIKRLKQESQEIGLNILFSRERGYRFSGNDIILNNLIMSKVDMMNSTDLFIALSYILFKEDLVIYPQQISKKISSILEEEKIPYVKEFLNRGSCILSLLFVKEKYSFEERIEKKEKGNNPAYLLSKRIVDEIKEEYKIPVSESLEYYLALLLTYVCEDTDILYDKNSSKFAEYLEISDEVLNRLELIFNYENENKQDYAYQLAKKLDFISFCKKYNFHVVYPFLLNKKRKFADIYSVVKMIILSLTNKFFTEDSIALVSDPCLEFLGLNEENIKHVRVVPNRTFVNDKNTEDCMLVLEKLFIFKDEALLKKLINNLGPQQKKQLCEILSLPDLKDVLKPENIIVCDHCRDFKKAIEITAEPLMKQGIIDSEFIEDILNASMNSLKRFVVFSGIMMPHGLSKKIGFSLLSLRKPVYLSEEDNTGIRIIILISAVDNKLHSKALAQLAEILTDTEEREKLINSETKEEIMHVLYQRKENRDA